MSEIDEARKLLRQFEQLQDHKERMQKFEDALDLLNLCIEDNEGVREAQIALNLKNTYLNKLIKQLPSLHTLDIDDWSAYTLFLLQKVPKETDTICSNDQAMKSNYDSFLSIWAKELVQILQRRLPQN